MASVQPAERVPKPSFAKVASTPYLSQGLKENNPLSKDQSKPSGSHVALSSGFQHGSSEETAQSRRIHTGHDVKGEIFEANPSDPHGLPPDAEPDVSAPTSSKKESDDHVVGDSHKSPALDDSNTNLSSSDSSVKPASLDGKSIASGTTFAMDEKESLRPDDSASVKAVEEQDFIATDIVGAGLRSESETDSRAFGHQLHEISVMDPLAQRGPMHVNWQPTVAQHPGATFVMNTAPSRNLPLNVVGNTTNGCVTQMNTPVPDEKLLEALESPRDRVFVLKLEKEIIEFFKNPKQSSLELPQSNSFYRMLAHRLADYYLLGHTVDSAMGAVRLHKTPFCRMAPPVGGLSRPPNPAQVPSSGLARQIMRRGGIEQAPTPTSDTTPNSETPSKATSEAGGDSSSDGGNLGTNDAKVKAALTREEREAKYNEVRQRIFGDAKESESYDNPVEDKDVSRSSSTSSKKKTKKQRSYNDDDFEARSQFNAYYPSTMGFGGFQSEGTYHGTYNGMLPSASFSAVPPNYLPQPFPTGTFPPMQHPTPSSQAPLSPHSFTPGALSGNGGSYPVTQQPMYDLSAEFQRGMQSFQSAGVGFQNGANLSSQPPVMFGESYVHPAQQWGLLPGQANHQIPQQHVSQGGFSDHRQPPGSAKLHHYSFGHFTNMGSPGGTVNRNYPSNPANFGRQQFNPQSQTFIPTGQSYHVGGQFPSAPQAHMNGSGNHPRSSSAQRVMMPLQSGTVHANLKASQNSTAAIRPPVVGTAHPLPQPVVASVSNQSSSIAKWGTPAHLPPKPPPPASTQPVNMDGQRYLSSFSHSSVGQSTAAAQSNPSSTNGVHGGPSDSGTTQ